MVQNTCSSVLGLENDHVFYFAINPLSSFTSTLEALLLIQITTISYCQDMRFGLHPPNLSQTESNSLYPRTVEKSFVLSYTICKLSLRQSDRSGSSHTPSSLRDRSFSTSSWWNNIVSVLQLSIDSSTLSASTHEVLQGVLSVNGKTDNWSVLFDLYIFAEKRGIPRL